ncbi:MAG: peptidoglycan DD-metalloendopeptidase family protein [Burkholderiaceae bacterium]|nr:peptidoglycan DD-metalloendopeptidase family protein [Burkholderiaceae bacterium]
MTQSVNSAVKSPPLAALLSGLAAAALLSACGSTLNRAPVEQRPTGPVATKPAQSTAPNATPAATPDAGKVLPGVENAGKPGYYTIKPGDTLIRIGLDNGQNWRDLVKWNGLDNPNLIEVGQVLRVLPPNVDAATASTRGVNSAKVETRPLDAKPGAAAASGSAATVGAAASAVAAAAPTPAPAKDGDEDVNWAWPASGNLLAGFDEARNKGLAIGGKPGDPVLAAADGRVVYAGSGLRGYGNLVIIKHNTTYLTAYAHNQTLLVKEDQAVRRGQKIAEMGSSDADQVKLHFEVRKQGKPIDPAKLLPAR